MIEQAMETVTTEIEITEDERRALTRFSSRIRSVDSSHVRSAPERDSVQNSVLSISNYNQPSSTSQEQTSMQQEVADAYRETIVEMDHYEEEYGNPAPEDIALEFGQQAAHVIFLKENLTVIDLQNLVSVAETSLKERKRHVQGLNRERDSLEQCDVELSDIEAQFFDCPATADESSSDIVSVRKDLIELERRCEALITRRQDTIHSRTNSRSRGVGEESLNRYLYGEKLPTACPVLHDAVSLNQDIVTQQERCERALASGSSTGDQSANESIGY